MEKFIFIFFLTSLSFAQYKVHIPIKLLCLDHDHQCEKNFLEKKEIKIDFEKFKNNKNKSKKGSIRFSFSPTKTFYSNSDVRIQIPGKTDLKFINHPIRERTSFKYYKVWEKGLSWEILKFIDEPTNTFVLTYEKGKSEFSLTYFHPKYLIVWA